MSFNLVIDSLNGSGDDGNLTFGIDWSFLADGEEYDMTFSYRSTTPVTNSDIEVAGTYDGGELYLSMPDLPDNNYEVVKDDNSNYGRASSSNIVGILQPFVYDNGDAATTDGSVFIFSTPHNFNPPVRVRKPLNNRFRIQLYAKVAAQNMDTATSRILMDTEAQDYVLILNFKKCSCGK